MFYGLLENLIELDTTLFYLLNVGLQNGIFDFLMPVLTNLDYWRIPLGLMAVLLLIFGKKKGRIAVLLLVLGITLSDQVCNNLLKPLIQRIRPCNVLENIHLLVNCTKAYSFPSSHAMNIFTGATLLSFSYRKIKVILFIIAILVSYSRIYVGVHYPFDVLAGVILGFFCAFIIITLFKVVSKNFKGFSYLL
ncbi:MAG: phosphatase PAP2 family protein [candidate division Zixibacteria bacterium]|nr:phosphatase PAP2 family protein [candidate division Zixibacteria bacterium]